MNQIKASYKFSQLLSLNTFLPLPGLFFFLSSANLGPLGSASLVSPDHRYTRGTSNETPETPTRQNAREHTNTSNQQTLQHSKRCRSWRGGYVATVGSSTTERGSGFAGNVTTGNAGGVGLPVSITDDNPYGHNVGGVCMTRLDVRLKRSRGCWY